MNVEEFLTGGKNAPAPEPEVPTAASENPAPEAAQDEDDSVELDVQKAVVESLAADKAAQDETINSLRKDNYALKTEIATLKAKIGEQNEALAKVGDILAKNSESPLSNALSILDRAEELPDRFPGETRDHILEILKAARDQAEKDGQLRRAQLLEGVLVANEPSGNLAKKRAELEKLFNDNGNIVSGPVIDELNKLGISHKNGEEYLLCAEILKRNY